MAADSLTKASKIPKKTRTMMENFTDFISWFLGSWWAVVFHTIWFSAWLIFNFDINLLTFSVSLEAIFIGIFLLMAANKAEIKRDLHEARLRKRDRESLNHDIRLDEKADRQLAEIKKGQRELAEEIRKVRKELGKLGQ